MLASELNNALDRLKKIHPCQDAFITMQEAYWMKVASGKLEKIISLQKLVKKWLAMKN
jgi:hypothetical protein